MAHIRMRIEEIEYRPDDRSLMVLGVDEFQTIVTIEIRPVWPRQLAADLEFVARHPNARVLFDGASGAGNEAARAGVDVANAGPAGEPDGDDR